eukprot:GHVT01054483.1.p2 GENE.GHVT01054483.1~~GHVT01054483.1.p2  ORF type:complete len:101 (-),score=11.20 GHVT01054483.1:17-319(-)
MSTGRPQHVPVGDGRISMAFRNANQMTKPTKKNLCVRADAGRTRVACMKKRDSMNKRGMQRPLLPAQPDIRKDVRRSATKHSLPNQRARRPKDRRDAAEE